MTGADAITAKGAGDRGFPFQDIILSKGIVFAIRGTSHAACAGTGNLKAERINEFQSAHHRANRAPCKAVHHLPFATGKQ